MQNKSISQTLLNNSQISGVSLKGLDTNLSDKGHGLYIESISSDRYIDLRLACEKPFWGHTHPLAIQYQYKNLSGTALDAPYTVLPKTDLNTHFKDFRKITTRELKADLSGEKLYLTLKEIDLLEGLDLNLIEQLTYKNELIIEEQDLMLVSSKHFFFTHKIKVPKVSHFHFLDFALIESGNFDITKLDSQESKFFSATMRYYNFILTGEQGKFLLDQNTIDDFFQSKKLPIKRLGHYLLIQNSQLTINSFLKEGIYLSSLNFMPQAIILAIPVSCTKDELLDTLGRILRVLKG